MHSKPPKALTLFTTLCAILLGGTVSAADPQVTEGFVNAPVAEVWRLVTTPAEAPGKPDLRIGGEIRVQYPSEKTGESETLVSEVLAFEPERMLALRIKQAPASFPPRAVLDGVWTVLYLTPSGEDMTHVRFVELGNSDDPGSNAAREYVAGSHRRMLDTIAKQYWPKCARCAAEQDENLE